MENVCEELDVTLFKVRSLYDELRVIARWGLDLEQLVFFFFLFYKCGSRRKSVEQSRCGGVDGGGCSLGYYRALWVACCS